MIQIDRVTSSSPTLQILKPFSHYLHGWLHALRTRYLIILSTSRANRKKVLRLVTYSMTNWELLWKTLGGSSSIWLFSKSLKWGYVLDLGLTVADMTICKRSYGFSGTFFWGCYQFRRCTRVDIWRVWTCKQSAHMSITTCVGPCKVICLRFTLLSTLLFVATRSRNS